MGAKDFDDAERAALYRAIGARRDVRAQFVAAEIEPDVLQRVLAAAHLAPSVGLSQPWRFILVRDRATREQIHASFVAANADAVQSYDGEQGERYRALRLEGILDAPLNIAVVSEDDPAQGHGLGRRTVPQTALYSTVCAIQNLWLAARVEGLGVGWVSILDHDVVRSVLRVPPNFTIVAYLCVGHVSAFAVEPDLQRAGWQARVPLADVVFAERFGEREKPV